MKPEPDTVSVSHSHGYHGKNPHAADPARLGRVTKLWMDYRFIEDDQLKHFAGDFYQTKKYCMFLIQAIHLSN